VWVDHRIEVVRRRSAHRLARRQERLHLVEGLLVAILDIDEVIQVIRTSDTAEAARGRLMGVFDLSEAQAEYILELRLRRLTKFSRLELEKEAEELRAEIAALLEILGDDRRLRAVVSAEMATVAQTFGTPRRTILLESAGGTATTATAAAPLEVVDAPCWALLSGTGLLARTSGDAVPVRHGRRSQHDVVVSRVTTTARADVGAVTTRGRVVRLSVLDLPAVPPTDGPPSLSGGVPVSEVLDLTPGERVLALVSLDADAPTLALGTAGGVVKRVAPEAAPSRDTWDVIGLRDGDTVVGACTVDDDDELVLVTTDAQLLRFPASAVRPQGRPAGGMAGIKVAPGQSLLFVGAVRPTTEEGAQEPVVVTVAGASDALPGTQAGTAKVTPFAVYPPKGRATGGVRAHRFLRGEDALLHAWVGPGPARATGSAGQAVDLPAPVDRRDGSGSPLAAPVHALG